MFKLIHNAIARIIQAIGGATSTPPVGRVPQERKVRAGKVSSASAGTKPQPLPAQSKLKRKPKAAQPTSAVASRKAEPKLAPITPGKRGRPRKTPA